MIYWKHFSLDDSAWSFWMELYKSDRLRFRRLYKFKIIQSTNKELTQDLSSNSLLIDISFWFLYQGQMVQIRSWIYYRQKPSFLRCKIFWNKLLKYILMPQSRGNETVEKNIIVFKYRIMFLPPRPNPCSIDGNVPE